MLVSNGWPIGHPVAIRTENWPRKLRPYRGVTAGHSRAQVSVLDCQGNQAVGTAGDVPGQTPTEPAGADLPVRVGGMIWPVRWSVVASVLAQATNFSIRMLRAGALRELVPGRALFSSWMSWSNSRCPSGTMCSSTRMALATGVMAIQGTLRSTPSE